MNRPQPSEVPADAQPAVLFGNNAIQPLVQRSMFWRPSYLEESAWLEHIPFAFWLIDVHRPRVLVELGSHYGVSYFAFCQAVAQLGLVTQCFAVDTWKGDQHSGLYDERVFEKVRAHNNARYSGFSRLVRSTFDEALNHFENGSIDLLHIDGLHTLEAVRHDFEAWLPKLSEHALVIMHDTNVRERNFGVFKLFEELRHRYPHFEFVHGHGLGVLGVGKDQCDTVEHLFQAFATEHSRQAVQEVFSRLGRSSADAFAATVQQERANTLASEVDRQKKRLEELTQSLDEANVQLASRSSELAGSKALLQSQIEQYAVERSHKDAHIGNLDRSAAQRDRMIENLHNTINEFAFVRETQLAEHNAHLAELHEVITERDRHLTVLRSTVAERDERIVRLQDSLNELAAGRDAQLSELNTRIAEVHEVIAGRDVLIENLHNAISKLASRRETDLAEHYARFVELQEFIADRDGRLAALRTTVAERDEQVTQLQSALATLEVGIKEQAQVSSERADQIEVLAHAVSERGNEIAALRDEVSRRDSEIAGLQPALSEREARIRQVEHALESEERELASLRRRSIALTHSTFWRFTTGIRRLWNYLEHEVLKKNQLFELSPLHHLQELDDTGTRWKAVGDDPHFAISPQEGSFPFGWVLIKTRLLRYSYDFQLRLYFELGAGMSETNSFMLPVSKSGTVFELVQLPKGVCGLRWDPMSGVGEFAQDPIFISHIGALRRIYLMLRRTVPMLIRQPKTRLAAAGLNWRRILTDLKGSYVAAGRIRSYEPDVTYERWIALNEAGADYDREQILSRIQQFVYQPLISIAVPVYNTPEPYLRLCLESVLHQSYPHWELCIADDASSAKHVRKVLEEFAARDPRVKVTYRATNGHISETSNSALAIATGDYVALLDHDDELAEHALYFIVEVLNAHPEAQVVYSDEDKIDANGARFDPYFKCDWNPDLFFSQNYVSHLGVYRRALLERINGFRKGVEGSQDQDLLLRCLPHVRYEQIIHVPRVLYHWRTLPGSTALASGEKSYTTKAGVKALTDFFAALGANGVVVESGIVPNTYRVRYPIPDPQPLVSLLIPTRDRRDLIETCVRSILNRTSYSNYEIVILDNQSREPDTLAFFDAIQKQDGRVRVIRYDRPFNYSAINNFGVQCAKGDLVGLINNDIEVISLDWLGEMVSHAVRPEIGCVGAKLYYSNNTIQHAGVILGLGGIAGHSHKHFPRNAPGYFFRLTATQNYSAVTAACLLVRKSVYVAVGGLDENNLSVAFNDVDLCLRVKEVGYRNLWTPYAELYHHESLSRGQEDTPEKVARFNDEMAYMTKKWGALLPRDPYYSPWLTRDREDFSINLTRAASDSFGQGQ